MYNIPTWLCQKRKYLFLTVLISGPQQTGIDIDVFLEPVMQEFKRLWKFGETMYDTFRQEDFTLRAIKKKRESIYSSVYRRDRNDARAVVISLAPTLG
jgi:hypothetical protein